MTGGRRARQLDPRIADILRRYEENPNDTKDVIWDCHGTWVVYHRALERVAARAGISFDVPQILRAERDEAVILVTARLGERTDWDIGEALINVNYRVSGKQATFVYAMALKRARDRLILKLIGLNGLLYPRKKPTISGSNPRTRKTAPLSRRPSPNPAMVNVWRHEVSVCATAMTSTA